MKKLIIPFIALFAATMPVAANAQYYPTQQITGGQFYRACSNPFSRPDVNFACTSYVGSIATALQRSGVICLRPRPFVRNPYAVSIAWIHQHLMYGGRPASFMISNGLLNAYPCQAHNTSRQLSPEQVMNDVIKFSEFMKATAVILSAFS
jgi:hypothetical protein